MLAFSSITFMNAALSIYLNSEVSFFSSSRQLQHSLSCVFQVGFNLLDIGLAFALMSVCCMFASFVTGQLADKWVSHYLSGLNLPLKIHFREQGCL